jgi:hypothetical protein
VQELYIDCVKKDWNTGIITHASIGRTAYDVMQIVRVLLNKQYSAYTYENNYKAYVYPRRNVNGNWWFLTTQPDSITDNSPDSLPEC